MIFDSIHFLFIRHNYSSNLELQCYNCNLTSIELLTKRFIYKLKIGNQASKEFYHKKIIKYIGNFY